MVGSGRGRMLCAAVLEPEADVSETTHLWVGGLGDECVGRGARGCPGPLVRVQEESRSLLFLDSVSLNPRHWKSSFKLLSIAKHFYFLHLTHSQVNSIKGRVWPSHFHWGLSAPPGALPGLGECGHGLRVVWTQVAHSR